MSAREASSPIRPVLAALTLAGVAYSACAGPPFRTDDPDVRGVRELELNVFFEQTLVADGREGVQPGIEFNYGPIENVQLTLLVPAGFATPSGEAIVRGFGDLELGVKYRFINETDSLPAVAVSPLVAIPTGDSDKGLGNGGSQVFVPLWLSKKWGQLETYGGGGYWINNGPNWKNYWFLGWVVQYELDEHWTLGGELFYNTGEELGQQSSTGFNLGGAVNFDEHNHILFSAGKGLRNAAVTNRVSTYVAYSLTF